MRVCCCCESWESGGIESFLTNVLLRMDRTGLEVDIVAAELRESVFTEQLREAGVRFYELSGSLNRIARNSRLLQGIFEERKYDVFHLHAYQALSFRYLRQAKRCGIPVRIAHSHNTALRKSRGRWLKLRVHQAARFFLTGSATHLWACSKQAAEFLFSSKTLREKGYRFIPNGIEVERFRFNSEAREQIRKELHCESKLVIGNVGRLCYQKNQAFLLEAFAEVHGKQPDSVLLLVGEGEDRPMLEEQAERLGIREATIFYGTCGQVERLYWGMDVFAFPSRFEGLGIAAVEAQAAGLPVLCSEEVPEEALFTRQAKRIPLEAGRWAQAILGWKAAGDRSPLSAEEERRFAVGHTAWIMEKAYREEEAGGR